MNEIRSLVSGTSSKTAGAKCKTVRFQNKDSNAADSGVESARSHEGESSTDCYPEGGTGRNREDWLKRLTEQQRQLYTMTLPSQLLKFMKNRQEM